MQPWYRKLTVIFLTTALIVIASCATINRMQWEQQYGKAAPVNHDLTVPTSVYDKPEYTRDIKPIFDRRCVVCHGCYDAPCQLKLTSFTGVNRGASLDKVYDGSRLVAENMTRLFIDAQSADEWRKKSFYPVLNENRQDPQTNLAASSLYQMLELKRITLTRSAMATPARIIRFLFGPQSAMYAGRNIR